MGFTERLQTTAVFNKAAKLKLDFPDKRVGVHVENLPFCPYPINENTTEESQLWIFTHHIQAELFLLTHYDILVSDRTIVDCIAYTQEAGFKDLATHMIMMSLHHMKRYSEISFRFIKNNSYLHEEGFRVCHRVNNFY